MILIDTSVWVNLFRDQSGSIAHTLSTIVDVREVALTRFNQLELLQGAKNEKEWHALSH